MPEWKNIRAGGGVQYQGEGVRLFVGPRLALVANAYAKLGVRNRAWAAAVISFPRAASCTSMQPMISV